MRLFVRYPSLAAWMVVLALVATGTLVAFQGIRVFEPSVPAGLEHLHGIVVATRAGEVFAVKVPGNANPVWFRVARGAPISFAHLRRHLQEHAPTDIYYLQAQGGGMRLAWIAD